MKHASRGQTKRWQRFSATWFVASEHHHYFDTKDPNAIKQCAISSANLNRQTNAGKREAN